MTRPLLIADLLCGAGGSSTGCERALRQLGREMELVCVNHWPTAIETHRRNHPRADLRALEQRIRAALTPLQLHSHEPQDIRPRVLDVLQEFGFITLSAMTPADRRALAKLRRERGDYRQAPSPSRLNRLCAEDHSRKPRITSAIAAPEGTD